jgi:hypothetical protein
MDRLPPILRRSTPRYTFFLSTTCDPQPVESQPEPLDLSGGRVWLRAKASPEAESELLFEVECEVDDNPACGKCHVRLTTSQTDSPGVVYYELRVVYASGCRARQNLWAGSFVQPIRETLAP